MTQHLDAHNTAGALKLEPPKSPRLRVAVVGGGVGRAHALAYNALPDHYELVCICDLDIAKAETLANEVGANKTDSNKTGSNKTGTVGFTASFSELLERNDIDLIDICTPPHLHVPMVTQTIQAGKHAICEKPIAASLKDVDALIALEQLSLGQGNPKRIMPIFQYRFGHGLQKLELLKGLGLLGKAHVATVETHWRRGAWYYIPEWRGKWATELGGGLLGHAIHAHDMLSCIMGSVKSVYARVATRVNPIEVEDCAAVTLEMHDGSLVSLSMTLGSSAEISRHRFAFANLVAESNTRPYTSSGDPWTFTADTPELQSTIEAALAAFQPQPEGYAGQFLRLHRALETGAALPVTLQDARASLELVTAMYRSARTGQAVQLPIISSDSDYQSWLP
jgi:predicted dehydrogenase